jgi:hypothetical protein
MVSSANITTSSARSTTILKPTTISSTKIANTTTTIKTSASILTTTQSKPSFNGSLFLTLIGHVSLIIRLIF